MGKRVKTLRYSILQIVSESWTISVEGGLSTGFGLYSHEEEPNSSVSLKTTINVAFRLIKTEPPKNP
jgi:hypothetical protein